jgi:hypothetical protein
MCFHTKIFCFLAILLLSMESKMVSGQRYEPSIMYEKESLGGLIIHTRGMGIVYQVTRHKSASSYRLFDFSLSSVKNPKEVRLANPDKSASRPYVFGKKNALYTLDASYGKRKILADRISKESIKLNLNYSIGPCLAILKPVYYEIMINNPDGSGSVKKRLPYTENDPSFEPNIIGTAPFFTGLDKTHFMAGAVGKSSISFEWGKYEDKFYSIETGIVINAFPYDVPIFAYDQNRKVFTNLFLTLAYGTRK